MLLANFSRGLRKKRGVQNMMNQELRKGTPKRGLGRGLASLLPAAFEDEWKSATAATSEVTQDTAVFPATPASAPVSTARQLRESATSVATTPAAVPATKPAT